MIDSNNFLEDNVSDLLPSMSPYAKCGYDVDDIEKFDSRYKCIFCSLIIREPIQLTECGHRSCRGGFDIRAATTTDGNVTCPCEDCQLITNKNDV
jgi:hypothetical protein